MYFCIFIYLLLSFSILIYENTKSRVTSSPPILDHQIFIGILDNKLFPTDDPIPIKTKIPKVPIPTLLFILSSYLKYKNATKSATSRPPILDHQMLIGIFF